MDSRQPPKRRLYLGEIELSVSASSRSKLRAAGEKLRSAAFIGLDMRLLVANDAVIRPAELSQGEGICGRSVEDEKGRAIRLENLAHPFGHAPGPFIIAVGSGPSRVRFGQSGPGLRANCRGVVALEFISIHREFPTRLRPAGQTPLLLLLIMILILILLLILIPLVRASYHPGS